MVIPANMLERTCAASLFASVSGVLALVFMVFLLFLFVVGLCSDCGVSRADCPCLHVWTCGVGVACHVGGK